MKGQFSHAQLRKRILVIFFLTMLIMTALQIRLGWIQFVRGAELTEKAWEQWNRTITARSERGKIFDRHGNLLAGNTTAETVVGIPSQVVDPLFTARALAPVLQLEEERILELITRERDAVYIRRKVDEKTANEVRVLNLPGITFTRENKRFYPNDTLLSQLLGFVGMDQGLSGLEAYFEEKLQGRDGIFSFPADNQGRSIPGTHLLVSPREGKTLCLTIDATIQFIVERELSRAMLEFDPAMAMALAVNPQTGELLAVSSKPDFNPNRYADYGIQNKRLFPVTDTFEPGSTFKLITLAAAVEENLFYENEKFYCEGYIKIAGHTMRCWTDDRGGHGAINFLEASLFSCNPAYMALGEKLGTQRFFNYIRSFGFGAATGIDYPGEGAGLVFEPSQVGPLELATTSFGQGISVTPLQQAMAIAAIANGGKLLRPSLIKEIRDADGSVVYENSKRIVRQVISRDTASRVAIIMEETVKEGSGINAAVEGYRIAGKTGTAQKVGPEGAYLSGEYILSFVGFAPVDHPQVLLYVAVDGARRGPQWGSQISAPLFQNMMQDILAYLAIPPGKSRDDVAVQLAEVPQLEGLGINEAGALLETKGLIMQQVGSRGVIVDQTPPAGTAVPMHTAIKVYMEDLWYAQDPEQISMPDLRGMTVMDTGRILARLGLRMQHNGSGIAVHHDPPAGAILSKDQVVTVHFSSPLQ